MPATTTGYATVNDGKLYYETSGEGQPLVLCHAGFLDSRMWDDQWEVFAQYFRAIRYDARGYGRSDAAVPGTSLRDDLFQLMQFLRVEQAHLIGCSMGGETILDVGLEHPERVLSLIPVSAVPGGFEMQGEPPKLLMEMMEAAQQGDLDRTSELQLRIWIDGPFRQPDQVDAGVRQRAAEMNRPFAGSDTWQILNTAPAVPPQPPAAERLDTIMIPTLIIDGELDDPEILRAGSVMAERIPVARKVIIPQSAHLPNMERPAEFNAAVLEFLQGA